MSSPSRVFFMSFLLVPFAVVFSCREGIILYRYKTKQAINTAK